MVFGLWSSIFDPFFSKTEDRFKYKKARIYLAGAVSLKNYNN